MQFLGKPKTIDFDNYTITFDILKMDESTLKNLKDLSMLDNSKLIKLVFKLTKKVNTINYKMQKLWFVFITKVLRANNVAPDPDAITAISDSFKREYLPCKEIKLGNTSIIVPPSISYLAMEDSAVSKEEFKEALSNIEHDYQSFGVDFSNEVLS